MTAKMEQRGAVEAKRLQIRSNEGKPVRSKRGFQPSREICSRSQNQLHECLVEREIISSETVIDRAGRTQGKFFLLRRQKGSQKRAVEAFY